MVACSVLRIPETMAVEILQVGFYYAHDLLVRKYREMVTFESRGWAGRLVRLMERGRGRTVDVNCILSVYIYRR